MKKLAGLLLQQSARRQTGREATVDDVRPDGAGTAEAKREEDEAAARGLEEDRGGIQAAAGRRTQRVWPLGLLRRTLVCPRGGADAGKKRKRRV